MRSFALLFIALAGCVALSCKRNAYYNFTEYSKYTKQMEGPRTWRHTYISSALEQELDYHDTVFSIVVINSGTIAIGDTRLHMTGNTDSTINFVTESGPTATLIFNFVNSAIVFKRAAQDQNSTNRYSFDVFTAI